MMQTTKPVALRIGSTIASNPTGPRTSRFRVLGNSEMHPEPAVTLRSPPSAYGRHGTHATGFRKVHWWLRCCPGRNRTAALRSATDRTLLGRRATQS
jgi:hypothetical protein